jgi:hypothetical protein
MTPNTYLALAGVAFMFAIVIGGLLSLFDDLNEERRSYKIGAGRAPSSPGAVAATTAGAESTEAQS